MLYAFASILYYLMISEKTYKSKFWVFLASKYWYFMKSSSWYLNVDFGIGRHLQRVKITSILLSVFNIKTHNP